EERSTKGAPAARESLRSAVDPLLGEGRYSVVVWVGPGDRIPGGGQDCSPGRHDFHPGSEVRERGPAIVPATAMAGSIEAGNVGLLVPSMPAATTSGTSCPLV